MRGLLVCSKSSSFHIIYVPQVFLYLFYTFMISIYSFCLSDSFFLGGLKLKSMSICLPAHTLIMIKKKSLMMAGRKYVVAGLLGAASPPLPPFVLLVFPVFIFSHF